MKNLAIRFLTGIVFVALLVGCIVWCDAACYVLFSIVAMLTIFEFCSLMNRHAGAQVDMMLNVIAAFTLFRTVYALPSLSFSRQNFLISLACYLLVVVCIFIAEMMRATGNPLRNLSLSLFSHVYIAVPFGLISLLAHRITDSIGFSGPYNYVVPLAVFIFLWVSDTGAYCCGSLLHRRFPAKLAPTISPNKTWVGSIGGGVLCLIASVVLYFCFGTLSLPAWIGLAAVVCIAGTLGDLSESLFKRQLGIKDSGNILPGHGGLLDRFDSALLAIPAAVVYLIYVAAF